MSKMGTVSLCTDRMYHNKRIEHIYFKLSDQIIQVDHYIIIT